MDMMNETACVMYDKELTLELLRLNGIPTIETVDIRKCAFPVVGRMHGHHAGQDIRIVNHAEQAREEGFDYFTKLYVIDKEYYVEVVALSIQSIKEAISHHAASIEFQIRTLPFGWHWVESGSLNEEWLQLSIRSLYVLGLAHGFVKIGVLTDGSPIITDVNPPGQFISDSSTPVQSTFTLGTDVEFMLDHQGDLVPASRFFALEGAIGCDERQIEKDSGAFALVEIRPHESESPHQLFENIRKLLVQASEQVPYGDIEFRAGSMPFSGYQCGGHIHFGIPVSLSILRTLDQYVAIPLAIIEDSRPAKRRRRTKHGGLGRYRQKTYGFEYLTLSSWLIHPDVTLAVLCLAKLVVSHHDELPSNFLFDPLIQRAYYGGNRTYLKQTVWTEIKRRLMNTSSYSRYDDELSVLFARIDEERIIVDSDDVRHNWKIETGDQCYDPGLTIQISRKLRNKFNLQIGQTTYIRTKKSITLATIDAHPFGFRNANSVKLSHPLRQALSLPQSWYPQVFQRNGVLSLGPVIGILASRPFWGQLTAFRHLCQLGKEKQVLVYVFEPQDIAWDQLLIRGMSNDSVGMYPFPDVVYDRYFLGGNDKTVDVLDVRTKLQSIYNIPFVNPPTLFQLTADKWRCHEVLQKQHKHNLPETRRLCDFTDVMDMLRHFGEVYLKPVHGAMGKRVRRIVRDEDGGFWMNSIELGLHRCDTEAELYRQIASLLGNDTHIVQEGISRKRVNEQYVEIRIYMQKNGQQKWMRTGMVARLCTDGILAEGLERNLRVSEVLQTMYPNTYEREKIHLELAEVARNVVATVEAQIGQFGELAIDVCIDSGNCIKIVELNSKPDNLFSAIHAFKLRNMAGSRLLNYAVSLAGYDSEDH